MSLLVKLPATTTAPAVPGRPAGPDYISHHEKRPGSGLFSLVRIVSKRITVRGLERGERILSAKQSSSRMPYAMI
jgi:hypothetical protein